MDLKSRFGAKIADSLQTARGKMGSIKSWTPYEERFCQCTDSEHAARFHFPLLRQIEIAAEPRFLAELAEVFRKRTIKGRKRARTIPSYESEIIYSDQVTHVLSDPALKILLHRSPSHYPFLSFSEDDSIPSDPSLRTYLSDAISTATPPRAEESPWWVVPADDLPPMIPDANWLVDQFGLFDIVLLPATLWLVKYSPSTAGLVKPNVLEAREYHGFWPAKGVWGQTVSVSTFAPGLREALHWHESPVGSNELYFLSQPVQNSVDWHAYCLTRAAELGS